MAAGAYKGLTIRIGADTSKLTSALRGVNSVIYKTSSEFRKLSRAAKLDPGNNKVLSAQIGAVANQATASAAKLDLLKKSIAEVSGQSSKAEPNTTIGQMAKDTENAALAAANARERYDSLNHEISVVSDSLRDLTGIDPSTAVREGSAEWEKAKQAILEWTRAAENADAVKAWEENNHTSVRTVINDLEFLRDTWQEASDQFEDAKLVESLHNAEVEATATEATINSLAQSMAKLNSSSDFSKSSSVTSIEQRMKLLNAATETATDRFKRLDAAAKLNPTSIGTATDRAVALREALETARAKADGLKEKLNAYKDAGIDKQAKQIGDVALNLERTKQAYADASRSVADLSGKYRNAQQEYQRLLDTGKGPDLQKKINDAATAVDKLERELKEAKDAQKKAFDDFDTAKACSECVELQTEIRETNAEIKNLGKGGGEGFGAGMVQAAIAIGDMIRDIGTEVIDASNDVDSAYRDMRKTVDATEDQYKKLYDAAMEYSQTHVTSADTMLEMEALAGQVGISADALQNFAEVAANLDVATDIDADEIALKMGQMVNVMSDLDEKNVQGFADALVDLGNKMPAQESSIMQVAQRLSSVADVAGFSTPEVMGWAAAIASTGQRSEAAATGISNTITAIQSAVSNGGDDLEAFAAVVGKSSDEFKEAWGKDASGTLRDFVGELHGLGPEAIKQLEDLGISGVRQTQTLLGLAKTVENVDKAIDISNTAWTGFEDGTSGVGAAADEANKKAEGFSGTLSKLQNSTKVLAASFGDALVPWMSRAASMVQWLTSTFDGMGDGFKDALVGVGGALASIAVVFPIIERMHGSLKKFFGSLAGFITKGIGSIKAGKLATDFANFATKVNGVGTALMTLGTSGAIAAAAIGGVAALVGGYYLKQYLDAKKHTEDFNNALSSIQGTTDGLHRDLLFGKDTVSGYGEAWSAARTDIDNFIESTQQHADAMSQTRDQTSTSIGMLEKYTSIIDKAIGAGDDYTGSMGELQWALDGLAQITGETYSAEDILSGTFEGEAGNADKLRDSIMKLVEAKKLESQLNAITSMRTEAVEGQMEAKKAIDESADAYRNYAEIVKKAHGDMSGEEFASYVANSKNSDAVYLRQLEDDWSEAKKVYDEWGDQIDKLDKEYDGLIDKQAYQESAAYGEREGIMQTTRAMKDALDAVGMTDDGIKELADSIERAGVSTKEFSEIGADSFAAMVDQSGGDIGVLTDMISSFNSLPIDDKEAAIHVEDGELVFANGERIVWNGTEWVWKSTGITVDAASVADATQQVNDMNAATDGMHDASANAEVTGNAKDPATSQNISNTGGAISSMSPNTVQAQVNGNAKESGIAAAISNTAGAIAGLVSKTVDVVVNYVQNGKAPGHSATGAYIPYNKIPKHAAGIFTRPTLTNIGWVGEDGAELYSGNSLVPLTNRKYSMPYIDDISDAVAKKLGGLGTVNNYYVNDAIVNGDAEIQAAFLNLFDTLTRKGAMNVG